MKVIQRLKNPLYRLLRWSEQYTKTDMVYLAHGGFWLTAGQVVSSLSALALAVAFANLVAPATYGTYKYILSIAAMFGIFSLPGMQTAISRAVAQGHVGIIHSATKQRVLFSLLGSFAALIGSGYYFLNDNIDLSLALLIIAATLPLFDTFSGYLAYLAGIRRFDLQTKYHGLAQIISVSVLVLTLFITDNILHILLAYFLPLSVIRTLLYWTKARSISKDVNLNEQKQTLTYGNHLTVMNLLGIVAGNIDKILLWKFLGPAQLAIYTFALAIPEQIKGPLKGVGDLAFPKFAAQSPEQIRMNMSALRHKLALYTLGLLFISIIYILSAPLIFQIIFPQYMESVVYSQVFVLSNVVMVASLLMKVAEAQRKTMLQYRILTLQYVVQIGLLILLVPLFGLWGAIFSLMVARAFFIIQTFFTMYRTYKNR